MILIKKIRGFILAINFKAYLEATGKKAVELAKIADKVATDTGVSVIVAPQFTDLKSVAEKVDIMVFGQHVDSLKPGAFTGHVVAEALKSAGAAGTLINHSEKRLDNSSISGAVTRCGEVDLYSLVCADTAKAAADIAEMRPDIIAVEPPDLIGSGVSVSKARPELITDSLREIRRANRTVKVLCGAGVSTPDDVSKALELGTEGVLVASSVVKSADPSSVLAGMADAIISAT